MELIDALFKMVVTLGAIIFVGLLVIGIIIAIVAIAYFLWGNWDN